tara:strand:+ start:159 stop:467 length:309 start_codon:yes stop_codon:yes gene_type:complete
MKAILPNPFSGKVATTVFDVSDKTGLKTAVRYHNTNIVEFTPTSVTLNSGGWDTATTKRRMNEVSCQYNLDFWVSQENFKWWVSVGPSGKPIPFKDGMTFPR